MQQPSPNHQSGTAESRPLSRRKAAGTGSAAAFPGIAGSEARDKQHTAGGNSVGENRLKGLTAGDILELKRVSARMKNGYYAIGRQATIHRDLSTIALWMRLNGRGGLRDLLQPHYERLLEGSLRAISMRARTALKFYRTGLSGPLSRRGVRDNGHPDDNRLIAGAGTLFKHINAFRAATRSARAQGIELRKLLEMDPASRRVALQALFPQQRDYRSAINTAAKYYQSSGRLSLVAKAKRHQTRLRIK